MLLNKMAVTSTRVYYFPSKYDDVHWNQWDGNLQGDTEKSGHIVLPITQSAIDIHL